MAPAPVAKGTLGSHRPLQPLTPAVTKLRSWLCSSELLRAPITISGIKETFYSIEKLLRKLPCSSCSLWQPWRPPVDHMSS